MILKSFTIYLACTINAPPSCIIDPTRPALLGKRQFFTEESCRTAVRDWIQSEGADPRHFVISCEEKPR